MSVTDNVAHVLAVLWQISCTYTREDEDRHKHQISHAIYNNYT
jgi:hypothetical protein